MYHTSFKLTGRRNLSIGNLLVALLIFLALPLTVIITQQKTQTRQQASTAGNIYYVSKNGSNGDGKSWQTAWNELNQIDWSQILPGDTIVLDGGSSGMIYTSTMIIGKSGAQGFPITIVRATEPGHNGTITFFGGRTTALPYCGQSGYSLQTSGVLSNGIVVGDNSYIVVDGAGWHGMKMYGYNSSGITFTANSHNDIVRNMELYDTGSPFLIDLHGSNHLFQYMDMHDEQEDAFQPTNIGNITVQLSWLHDSRPNPSYPGSAFNQCNHNDGMQIWTGNSVSGLTFDQDVIGPIKENGLILGNGIVSVSNVHVTNTLIIDTDANNIWGSPATNWTIDHVTSFAQNQNLIIDGSNHTVTNSVFYGGLVSLHNSVVNQSGNCQWKTTGDTLQGQTVDPQFASDLSTFPLGISTDLRTSPTAGTLQNLDFSLQSTSPCKGAGSSITSVSQFLQLVNTEPTPTPVSGGLNSGTPTTALAPTVISPIVTTHASPALPTPTYTITPTITLTGSSSLTSSLVIYDNAVSSKFYDYSYAYAAVAPCDKSLFVSYPCSYGIMYKAYGAFNAKFKVGSFSTSPYKHLIWNMFTNNQSLSFFSVFLVDANANLLTEVYLSSAYVTGVPKAGWVHISVPVSLLNSKNMSIQGLQIQNKTDQVLSTIHLDDIQFSTQ